MAQDWYILNLKQTQGTNNIFKHFQLWILNYFESSAPHQNKTTESNIFLYTNPTLLPETREQTAPGISCSQATTKAQVKAKELCRTILPK